MAIDILEHDTPDHLIELMDRISAGKVTVEREPWGVTLVKRKYLRPTTNEAFQLLVTPILEKANEAHIFYITDTIYVVWRGKQKTIYMQLRSLIVTNLMQPGLNVDPTVVAGYRDPYLHGDEIKSSARTGTSLQSSPIDDGLFAEDEDEGDEAELLAPRLASGLSATREQIALFAEIRGQAIYRKNLQILVVEDHLFAQKLLCEILRGVRLNNNNESPGIDAVTGIQDAWKIFLKKAPDIIFIDLNLADGSGHTLARAIREIDQNSRVVIVTANNYDEEVAVARQNNVDFFITKPYNKKQILECLTSYVDALNQKGGTRRKLGEIG